VVRRAAARAGADDRRDGLAGLAGRLVLYAGTESHSCVVKAAEVLGLGSAAIQVVPSDPGHRMRPGELVHVDGAYGAPPVLLLDGFEAARDGLARADSVAVDAHKWLYAPVDAGLVLIRDGGAARDTFSLVPPDLRTDGGEDGPGGPVWFSEYGLEQARPFRALKVWMQLRHLGRDGYRRLIAADPRHRRRTAARRRGVG